MLNSKETTDDIAKQITKDWSDRGTLIEGGFRAMLVLRGHKIDDPGVADLRRVYYSGAQHLFASMMNVMEEDREPTPTDMRRVELMARELEKWAAEEKRLEGMKQ